MAQEYINRKPKQRYDNIDGNAMARLGDFRPEYTYYAVIGQTATMQEAISTLDYGVNVLNERARHTMDSSDILKYPLMAVVEYDFSVHGGTQATVALNGGIDLVPDNALIYNVF